MANESTDYRVDIRQRLELYHGIDRDTADAIMRDLEPYGLKTEAPFIMDVEDVVNATVDRKATESAIEKYVSSRIEADRESFCPVVYVSALDMARRTVREHGMIALDNLIADICDSRDMNAIGDVDHYIY